MSRLADSRSTKKQFFVLGDSRGIGMDQRFWLHPEYVGIMERIRDNPEDIAPRLIAADWIEDNDGGPWAGRPEYIRECCGHGDRSRLKHVPLWKGNWPDHPGSLSYLSYYPDFRGWLSKVYCSGDQFADIIGVSAVAHPLEVVHLSSPPPWLKHDRHWDKELIPNQHGWSKMREYRLRGIHFKASHCVTRSDIERFGIEWLSDQWTAELAAGKCVLHHEYAPLEDRINSDYYFWLRKNTDAR